jgi:hypothetical protein
VNSRSVWSGSADKTIIAWSIEDSNNIPTIKMKLPVASGSIWSLLPDAHDNKIWTASEDGNHYYYRHGYMILY